MMFSAIYAAEGSDVPIAHRTSQLDHRPPLCDVRGTSAYPSI